MLIAVDKNSIHAIEKDENKYVYIFDEEPLIKLMNTGLRCINYKHCDFVDINTTEYDISCLKKTKVTNKNWNKFKKKNYKLGIIIPNCNYSKWLPKCFNSILMQTYDNYEIIFVDDVSTDDSVKVVKEICCKNKLTNVKIIELKQKRLNGGARNEAYLHLSKDVDYVYYIDSDDWLIDEKVFEDINNKLQTKPDVVFVGLISSRNGRLGISKVPEYKDKYEAIKGWSGSCGKVIKKELAMQQECLYNEGTLKEDKNQHCKICIHMNRFVNLSRAVYVWNQDNTNSVTTIRDKVVWGTSTIRHYADTLQLYLSEKGKDPIIDQILEERVKMTREEMLNGNDRQW